MINATTAEWKVTVIDSLFLPHEAEVIKSIPISSHLPPNKLIWTETRNGLFLVRSAYKLAVNQFCSVNRGSSLDTSNQRRFWRKVWCMQVPHKIHHFVWRACRDVLPTKQNLLKRKIIQEEVYERCKEAPETVGHVLWEGRRAREAWECSKLVFRPTNGVNLSFQDIIWSMLMCDDVGDDHVALITTTAWALWHNWNETRYGGVRKSGQQLSFGVVIRDEEGRLEAALSKKIHAPLGVVEVEAKAFEMGLLFAKDIGVRDVVLEGDSMVVYNALCNFSSPPSSIATVVQGIQKLCGDFRTVGFSHVRRQGNVPAHLLAKHASSIDDYVFWIEEDPCYIMQALIHDVISFSHMQ
nr:uncharacterized protein LOC112028429 [Quercus suber]